MFKKLLSFLFLGILPLAAVMASGMIAWGFSIYPKPGPLKSDQLVYIAPGSSARGISTTLLENGVIDRNGQYIFLAAIRIKSARLQAGEYQFHPATSIKDAIALLESGKVYQRQITVAEGLTSAEIASLVTSAEALEGEIAKTPPEGALLPETYNYQRGETRDAVIERMQKAMNENLARIWAEHDPDLPLKSPQEMVTLASVVEKETGIATERPRVAGVFINRLKSGIPLQSDPTVIYALTLGKAPLGRAVLLKDLETPSPYNTYQNKGLPPGPIANPGKESLMAVAHPERHDYIFFVADGTGGHAFAKTLKEHNKNVENWRKINR